MPGKTDKEFNEDEKAVTKDLQNLKGTFDECLEMASIADIDNVNVPFLHINQIIENKKIVNRPQDQIDVEALEQILKLRDNS